MKVEPHCGRQMNTGSASGVDGSEALQQSLQLGVVGTRLCWCQPRPSRAPSRAAPPSNRRWMDWSTRQTISPAGTHVDWHRTVAGRDLLRGSTWSDNHNSSRVEGSAHLGRFLL